MDLFLIPICYDAIRPEINSPAAQYILGSVLEHGVMKTLFGSQFREDPSKYFEIYSAIIDEFDVDLFLEDITDVKFLDRIWGTVESNIKHIEKQIDDTLAENYRLANHLLHEELKYVITRYSFLLDRNHLLMVKEFKDIGTDMSYSPIGNSVSNTFGEFMPNGLSYFLQMAQQMLKLFISIKIIQLSLGGKLKLSRPDIGSLNASIQTASQKLLQFLPTFFP